ncbi:nuclear transport factor 2 family protein [Paradesertivirga mongoliensis]|uniref:Nuclear transport factor 2 family protein n=1 Tax=Paradesertivirga mongoliensis TaxID=2100740 RepID=A0ABW4ZGG6_9SPHI|nr:nuclear transport factor 2 family protein [Pedobacter mongoliensis]
MKTIQTLLAATFMVLSLNSFATEDPKSQKLGMDYALKTYIDAIASGKVKGFAEILDSDVKFTVTRGEKIINYSKSEMLSSLKNSENISQNCQTDHTIVEQSATQAIIKVTMKYDAFSRINYVTMAQTSKGWKITNVSSVFI